ncbi:uncharacterized protein LOC112560096 isoform X2 [Pomacea canaliculata]|nr:uncharacterized protein LOC112560096 isoform X2 [Pomacea canaliculata]XP_025087457.1 uncharacterized protein LOC112560096 isoform X2 [Pomacea canaliculata]XP_025087459.1 uncharacterized protein LOC112560096 isoform X2 [Pomacea canaliculata]XP_025087460.1 uncharacterized protein LOC112560096 isoform X2 [Pomacea canaliculata]XP_025087461.1 uncharacterized protein LOC112560096 isoform X2 [Pomacea canaliculata]XP_025087462.1 uncharacterized protein LOC112560096 isoform X2 [Pomacea canaliculata]
MSACQQLQQEFLLLFILLCSVWCATNSKIGCPYEKGSDYFDGKTEAKDITYGDCSFENDLCYYTQACTNGSAKNWTVLDGRAVCRGSGEDYNSFSVLLSPLLKITRNTSLEFNYTRRWPGTLSVFVATSTEITEVFPEQKDDAMSPKPLIYINPSVVKIGFRARKANSGYNVTLSHVKLQAAPSTDVPAPVTSSGTPSTCDQSTISSATPEAELETQKQEDSSNAGVIAGVLVAVVVVVAAGVIGIIIWRRHKQRQKRNSGQETVKGELNIYQSADLGVMTTAATMPSPNKSLTKSPVNPVNAGNKATPGVMGSSSNQYDVPRNGLPAGPRVVKDEQSGPPDLTSPFAGDCEDDGYHILEDDSAMGASQATGVYSLARNEDDYTDSQ